MDIVATSNQRENEQRVAEEYLSSLSDLNCNSKPLINMLTMLAEENIEFAPVIVKVVEQHIAKVPPEIKLPILYLIDSIVKNVKSTYVQLFGQCIVNIFCGAFEKVNEKIRERMYALRQTWNEVFSAQKLYALDVKVKCLDHNWPITAKPPSIHVNPNFLKANAAQAMPTEMEKILQDKTRELLELKKRKLELELEATMKHLEEQEKQFSKTAEGVLQQPVEALVAANVGGIRPQTMPAQMMPGIMPPRYMGGPANMPLNPVMRPAMFHPNMRGAFRPNIHPNMMNVPAQSNAMPVGMPVANANNKPKVHPVNPALLNSVRQRDPRLQRQQQQRQQQLQQAQNGDRSPNKQQNTRSSSQDNNKHDNNHKSNHKSPTRMSSSNSRSSGSNRSGKNSQRDKERDRERERERERDRKRSESKSSTTSSSSSGSTNANSERKKGFAKSSEKHSSKCDKDAFEIAPLSTAFKRKSSSPSSSPSKQRDSKRTNIQKSRHSSRSKTRSRSRSPDHKITNSTKSPYGDIDLRRNSTSSTSSSLINSPDKKSKSSNADVEMTAKLNDKNEDSAKLATTTTSSSSTDTDLDKTTAVAEHVTGLMDIDLRPQFVVASTTDSTASPAISTHDPVFESSSLTFSSSSSSNNKSLDFKGKFMPASVNVVSQQPTATTMSTTNANFFINLDNLMNTPTTTTTTATTSAKNVATTTTSSPKVSFKIQKIFNKLDKSTENLLSSSSSSSVATTTSHTATISSGGIASNSSRSSLETIKESNITTKNEDNKQIVSKDNEEDGKKRPLTTVTEEEEPLAKKSKSAKIDTLFGSEDVDLRQLIPPVLAAPTSPDDDIAPPPPSINISNEIARDTNENWDNLKTDGNKNLAAKTTKSSLEDVRAKLAKTAKLSKLSKLDKLTRDIDHRNKIPESQMVDDTLEANDEKIRTMIAQAQELLESNSISQEQYRHLLKTVMSINETNKLKEAKRRESLSSKERNLAMQAVLKKRIPKLNKAQAANEQNANSDSQPGDSNTEANNEDSMHNEDKQDSNEEPTAALPQTSSGRANRGPREKRGPKVSKWGERVMDPPAAVNMPMGPGGPQQRPWNSLMVPNKRSGIPPFRGGGPQNMHPSWPISGGGNVNNMSGAPPPFGSMRGNVMPNAGVPQLPVIPKPCNSIDNPQEDLVRTITIDGAVKEIRFYDKVAIVFMEVDQPREIGFQNGQRSICIDNNDPVVLQFNDGYKPVQIDGETFNLRFGFPSRELYIDDHWYEIYFGGPPISVPIRNTIHMLKAEGPPPQVNIGPLRRDLVVGKINMIVDAHNVIPLFLDARLQTFRLADKEHTIQFADNLLTVLLDGIPTRVEYGGLPKSLVLGGKKYFVRFGALPQGVVAGKVLIKDMLYVETKPPNEEEVANQPAVENATNPVATTTAEINPVDLQKTSAPATLPILPAAALSNINIDELFQKLVSTGILGGSSGILPVISNTGASSAPADTSEAKTESSQPGPSASTEAVAADEVPPPAPPAVHMDPIKPIDLSRAESIKTRQAAIVETLYSGMQCSSCGVRFPPEQTIKYSQHLDWHFRQNRRERDTSRKAHARKWYYDLNDWVQYEEIEDLEEREKNFFESQQNDPETLDEASNQRSPNSPIPSCPAGADDVDRACDMCQEKFEQFYDNELEEWHLRCAIRIEDKIYHPLCYEDYKASLNPPAQPTNKEEEQNPALDNSEISLIQIEDDNAVDIVIKLEEDDKDDKKDTANALILDDDEDDDVIVLPNEEPSVTEIVDDDDEDEYVPANVTREQMGNVHEEEEGQGEHNETAESDVEIQEPHIPFTDLDTYVEKPKPDGEDAAFMNVKIKQEPKEEEDEDDGFEEVGTVVQAPEEISLNSSEDTQIQMIESSNTALSPLAERPASTTPSLNHNEDIDSRLEAPATDLNISMDGNIDTSDEHNLSAAGHVPSVPLASLVNKIKINITKNTVTTSSNTSTSSNNATGLPTMSSHLLNQTDSLVGHAATSAAVNPIPTISTIPVLCGGTTISSIVGSGGMGIGGDYDEYSSAVDELGENSVSTISVIGSYGSAAPTITHLARPVLTPVVTTQAPKPATPPPIEETITYELKPALQKANLKKKEKVICGNETSGLCSIM